MLKEDGKRTKEMNKWGREEESNVTYSTDLNVERWRNEDKGKEEKKEKCNALDGYKCWERKEKLKKTRERKRRGKQHTLWIEILRKEGKRIKERKGREKQRTLDANADKEGKRTRERKRRGKQHTLDRNTEKRRNEHKGKEEKRKATHSLDINAEKRRKDHKGNEEKRKATHPG
jgi:hypothetical protein